MRNRKNKGLLKKFKSNTKIEQKNVYLNDKINYANFRSRLNIRILDLNNFSNIPSCSHGPCLLFSDIKNNKWFGCAVFRSLNNCNYKIFVQSNDKIDYDNIVQSIISLPLEEYGKIRIRYNELRKTNNNVFWCKKCLNYVKVPHVDPVEGPFNKFVEPFKLLDAIKNDKGEAQYWFCNKTLEVLTNALKNENFNSVLCIGAPTVFEHLKQLNLFQLFLLDFDDRLALFYKKTEFARYSMLNNYFYHQNSQKIFFDFLKISKNLVIVCDPPFGVYVAALMKTLNQIKTNFVNINLNYKCKFIIFLPIFVGKHILKTNNDFSMVDYRVTYTNHKDYSKFNKSIVRIFTNVKNQNFDLSTISGYKFCALCNRFVTNENKHCKFCKECTSKDGSKYVHCFKCKKCVKLTYNHCLKCNCCHLFKRCIK